METCASAPFDHAKADLILRSADGVEFRVFKLFLSLASPFFESMFDLPQTLDGDSDQEMKDGLAVITVSEDSKTLDSFLRFCYPSTLAEDPSLESLADVVPVIAAAKKYSLGLIEKKVCQALVNPKVLETESLGSFAIARNARLKHETLITATHTLRQPLIPARFVEIELITASDLLALLTYHKNCSIAVQASIKDLKWMTDHYSNQNACTWMNGLFYDARGYQRNCGCARSTDTKFSPWGVTPVGWWATYMQETFELLVDRPSGDTVRTEAEKAIQKVRSSSCATCPNQVKVNMTEFGDLLARKVEEAVAAVELQMDF
ncbi:hypothetical protein M405DRAFT_933151 [Rhizopogon salebrosus TDB-379]|nr:hypothetical protein M405DRAFT_933151 [Rhizopogon salebrosus TDB-379]